MRRRQRRTTKSRATGSDGRGAQSQPSSDALLGTATDTAGPTPARCAAASVEDATYQDALAALIPLADYAPRPIESFDLVVRVPGDAWAGSVRWATRSARRWPTSGRVRISVPRRSSDFLVGTPSEDSVVTGGSVK
jgi:hypothetical protein